MTTAPLTTPFDLNRCTLVHFDQGLGLAPLPVGPSFWEHQGASLPELATGRVMCLSEYTDTWSYVECHPDGDELVLLISGDVDFVLEDARGVGTVTLQPGQAAIVPAGTWHRAVVRAPSQLLFVTPTPAATVHRRLEVAHSAND